MWHLPRLVARDGRTALRRAKRVVGKMRSMTRSPTLHGNDEAERRIRFGRHVADLESGELLKDGQSVEIEPLPCKLLLHLIRHRHRVVSKQELAEDVFDRPRASSASLARAAMKVRRALGEDIAASVLFNVPRVGYRFVGKVDGGGLEPQGHRENMSLALLPFDHAVDDASIAWVESALPSLIGEILESDQSIRLVTMPSVLRVVARADQGSLAERVARLQRATGAVAVVHARVWRAPEGLRAEFRLFNERKITTGSVTESLPVALACAMAQALGQRLGRQVDFAAAAGALPRDPLAVEAYVRGRQAEADQRKESALHLYRLADNFEPGHSAIKIRLLRQLAARADTSDEAHCLAAELLAAAESANDRAMMVRVHDAMANGHLSLIHI